MGRQLQTSISALMAEEFKEMAELVGINSGTLLSILITNFLKEPYDFSIHFSDVVSHESGGKKIVSTTVSTKTFDLLQRSVRDNHQTVRTFLKLLIIDVVKNKKSIQLDFT